MRDLEQSSARSFSHRLLRGVRLLDAERALVSLLKKPGLDAPGRGAHSFRHTAATLMVCNGEPLHLHEGGDRLIQSAFEYERNRSLAMNEGGLREGLVEGDLGAHRLGETAHQQHRQQQQASHGFRAASVARFVISRKV